MPHQRLHCLQNVASLLEHFFNHWQQLEIRWHATNQRPTCAHKMPYAFVQPSFAHVFPSTEMPPLYVSGAAVAYHELPIWAGNIANAQWRSRFHCATSKPAQLGNEPISSPVHSTRLSCVSLPSHPIRWDPQQTNSTCPIQQKRLKYHQKNLQCLT